MLSQLRGAVAFLTVVGGSHPPDARTLRWFPLVGGAIGGVLAVAWILADDLWSPPVVALLIVLADLGITGLLHVDGLADSADGLLPHLDRDRRLEVMRDPGAGAFALAVVPAVVLARWVALAGDLVEPAALIGLWAGSRTVMAVVPAVVDYARDEGLASAMLDGARRWFVVWLFPAGVLLAATHQLTGLVALAAGLAGAAAVVALARRRLGGFTGDVLGAAALVTETVALVVLNAR